VLYADALLPSLVAVAALAAAVNVVELLCTAGLPAIYTAVLTQQDLGAPAHYAIETHAAATWMLQRLEASPDTEW
jgi:hypothetical protein